MTRHQLLDDHQQHQLEGYVRLLLHWNQTHNLTGWHDHKAIIAQLTASLQSITPLLPQSPVCALDLGTGGGIPGIPLAILRPDMEFLLLDSRAKKIAFVREAIRLLKLTRVAANCCRIEDHQPQTQGYNLVVSRAFGSIDRIVTLTSRLVAPQAQYLLERGSCDNAELQWCKARFEQVSCHTLRPPANGLVLSLR